MTVLTGQRFSDIISQKKMSGPIRLVMFYSLGADSVLETCTGLANPYVVGASPHSNNIVALGLAWRRMLSDRQDDSTIESPLVGWKWISNPSESDYLAEKFRAETSYCSILNSGERANPWPELDDQQIVSDGWQLLCTQEPVLDQIASVLITTIFSTPSPRHPGSGSLPARLGAIYINPTDKWGSQNVVGCLIREVTHQMIWIDDQKYGHYPDPVPNFVLGDVVPTSKYGEHVPLSKAFSRVVVAAEILSYREKHPSLDIPHESHAELTERSIFTARSIRSMADIKNLTTGRFRRVLNAAEDRLAAKRE